MPIKEVTKVTVTSSGEGTDQEYQPDPMTNTNGPAAGPVGYSLAAGDNAIAVPTGAWGFVLTPPATSGNEKRIKSYAGAGATGVAFRTDQTVSFPLPTGTTQLHVWSAGVEVVRIHWT